MFELKPTQFFLEQLDSLSTKTKRILTNKLELVKLNPFRYKRIKGHDLLLFRIRFNDKSQEKRLIYSVDGHSVKIVCILDRKNDYKDLKGYLKKLG